MADEALVPGSKNPQEQDEHTRRHGVLSTLMDFFKTHGAITVGAIVGFAVVAVVLARSRSTATNAGSTSQAGQCVDTNGNAVDCSSPNAQGSLAGYQNSNTATALDMLQTQLNNLTATVSNLPAGATGPAGPQGPIGKTGPQGPSGTSGILPTLGWTPPLIPYSQTWSGKHYFPVSPGHRFDWQGVSYWIVSNTGGYIKGVPGATSAGQAAGKSTVTLYAPSSAYQKPVLNPLANHSPMLSNLAMSQNATSMQDLSHPGISGGGGMQFSPVSHIYPTWYSH